MSRYEDLKWNFIRAKEADIAHWNDLREMSKRFCKEFREYLGVPNHSRVTVNGESVSPVMLGRIGDLGRFESLTSNESLKSTGKQIEFAIRLTYDDAKYSFPSNYIVFRCGIEKCPEGYKVVASTNDFDEVSAIGPLFTELFKEMYEISLKNIIQ